MKKIFLIAFCIFFSFCGCTRQPITPLNDNKTENNKIEYRKSIWLCYFELSKLTMQNDELSFTNEIDSEFSKLKRVGFNTITVQVRPCADAFYNSSYFPVSKYCFGKEGSALKYDPLKIICSIGKKYDLNIEAWINPYRVSQSNNIENLSENNIAKKWYRDDSTKSNVYINKSNIYFNPASMDVTKLIVNGVIEIIKNYDVSAIHFDDYFYPTTDENIDKNEYKAYLINGGKLSLFEWRRDIVSNMVKSIYNAIKKTNKDVEFGISPSANIEYNLDELYADVKLWASKDGYVDYICPQVYYGFENEILPFDQTVKKWQSFTTKKLYIGLPLYKCSNEDKFASKNNDDSKLEFVNNNNIISRQIEFINKFKEIDGYYIFSYSSLYDKDKKQEVHNMINAMQNNNQA